MSPSRGARRCLLVLRFLSAIDLSQYSRDRVCRATKLSTRTVNRALSTLMEIGAIARERGGRATPAKIRVLMTIDEFLAHQVKSGPPNARTGPPNAKSGPPSDDLNLKEYKHMKSKAGELARKPVDIALPPETIETPGGRVIINPAWQRIRDAVHASREQVLNARNPQAYQRAIIRRVLEEAANG